jgi:hypothetical protein
MLFDGASFLSKKISEFCVKRTFFNSSNKWAKIMREWAYFSSEQDLSQDFGFRRLQRFVLLSASSWPLARFSQPAAKYRTSAISCDCLRLFLHDCNCGNWFSQFEVFVRPFRSLDLLVWSLWSGKYQSWFQYPI